MTDVHSIFSFSPLHSHTESFCPLLEERALLLFQPHTQTTKTHTLSASHLPLLLVLTHYLCFGPPTKKVKAVFDTHSIYHPSISPLFNASNKQPQTSISNRNFQHTTKNFFGTAHTHALRERPTTPQQREQEQEQQQLTKFLIISLHIITNNNNNQLSQFISNNNKKHDHFKVQEPQAPSKNTKFQQEEPSSSPPQQ